MARQADVLPGIYYAILGMKTMRYRLVAIPPHLFAHSMHAVCGIARDSVIRPEVFLLSIYPPILVANLQGMGCFTEFINHKPERLEFLHEAIGA